MLSDASRLFKIFWNFLGCFQRHCQESLNCFQIFRFYSDHFRSFHNPAVSSKFYQILPIFLASLRIFQNPRNSLKFVQIVTSSLRFLPILSEFPNFFHFPSDSFMSSQISIDFFRISQFLSNSLRFPEIPTDSFRCFQNPSPSGILKIPSNFSIPLRSFQILSQPCSFFQIRPVF